MTTKKQPIYTAEIAYKDKVLRSYSSSNHLEVRQWMREQFEPFYDLLKKRATRHGMDKETFKAYRSSWSFLIKSSIPQTERLVKRTDARSSILKLLSKLSDEEKQKLIQELSKANLK